MVLLRGMNPQALAMDEITAPEDVEAAALAAGCGVALLAAAHGASAADLRRRPLYRTLLGEGIFTRLVVPRGSRRQRRIRGRPAIRSCVHGTTRPGQKQLTGSIVIAVYQVEKC